MRRLLAFLDELEKRQIFYRLDWIREDSVMVEISVPGERWEVEFMSDDWPEGIQIEKFISAGRVSGCRDVKRCKEIERLLDEYSD